MKNCAVALSTTPVRAMAMVPISFGTSALASFLIGSCVGFWVMSGRKPPPWIMKLGITR